MHEYFDNKDQITNLVFNTLQEYQVAHFSYLTTLGELLARHGVIKNDDPRVVQALKDRQIIGERLLGRIRGDYEED